MIKFLKKLQIFDVFVDKIIFVNSFIYFFLILISFSCINNLQYCDIIINKIIKLSILVFLVISMYYIISQHYSIYLNIIFIFIYIILAINYYIVRNGGMIVIFSYMLILQKVDIEKYMKLFFTIILFGIIFVLIFKFMNIIPEIYFVHNKFGLDVNRYSLGFTYPNQISHYVYTLTSLYVYIRKEKIKFLEVLIILFLNIIMFILTWTINSLFSSILIIIFSIFLKYNKIKILNKLFDFIAKYIFIICFIFILFLTYLYSMKFPYFEQLNALLQGRLILNVYALKDIGITLFGTTKTVTTLEYFYIDSGFINTLLSRGIIIFILYMFINTYFSILCVKFNNKWMNVCLIVCAYHSIFDASFELINFSPYIIYFFTLLYSKKECIN